MRKVTASQLLNFVPPPKPRGDGDVSAYALNLYAVGVQYAESSGAATRSLIAPSSMPNAMRLKRDVESLWC
jgi:hypothetical protein